MTHFWIFHHGNPIDEDTVMTFAGHINFDTVNVIATGTIVIKAVDNSWLVHATFSDFTFTNNLFNGSLDFTTVNGTAPVELTGSVPAGPVPIGVMLPLTTQPNASFIFGIPPATP